MAKSKVPARPLRIVRSAVHFRWTRILALAFVLVVHAPLQVDGQESGTAPESVSAAFARLQKSVDAERTALEAIRSSERTEGCANAQGIPIAAVQESYKDLRTEAFAAVKAPEAYPLREHLKWTFPSEPTRRSRCFPSAEVADAKSVDETYRKIRELFASVEQRAKRMTVIVFADQPRALVTIQPSAGGIAPAPRWTTSTFDGLYRGLYRLTVEKQGFGTFDKDLGELTADTVTIECELAPVESNVPSVCAVAR